MVVCPVTNMGIDLPMTLGIVLCDMLELRCLVKGWHIPVQFSQPFVDSRVSTPDVANIAFEVLDIRGLLIVSISCSCGKRRDIRRIGRW